MGLIAVVGLLGLGVFRRLHDGLMFDVNCVVLFMDLCIVLCVV